MNIFDPLSTYSSPWRSAVVWMPETSDPAFGSVSANEQRSGSSRSGFSHVRFCSSVPASRTGADPSVFATSETAIPEQPHASSSPTRIPSNTDRPLPPSSCGMWTFMRPTSCAFAITSAGCVWCSSYSAATGRISFAANSCASARRSLCSSVRANEIPLAVDSSAIAIPASRWYPLAGSVLGFLARRCVPVCEWDSVSHTARSQEGAPRREAARGARLRRAGAGRRPGKRGSMHRLTRMNFELTDEQRLIQQTVRDFVDERVLPNAIENDIKHHLDLGIIEGMAELGLLGIVIPEEYGGAGVQFSGQAVAAAGGR